MEEIYLFHTFGIDNELMKDYGNGVKITDTELFLGNLNKTGNIYYSGTKLLSEADYNNERTNILSNP